MNQGHSLIAKRIPSACAAALILYVLAVTTTLAADPAGLWYAEGGAAQVRIDKCGNELCGRVVWLRSPFDEEGCELRDGHNPDPSLRERSVVGLQVLSGLEPSSADGRTWSGGAIYDPANGSTYRCSAQLEGNDRLRIRGYIGIPLLGRTTTWIRVGSEGRMCRR